ncbi:Pentafunctional AROM polypeptide [Choanephora cucurbitarum]|uniref:3-dehydroquinate synthase n=1 Tax=Choanephora cucurbitarum TaxID=101091 RepID=A0A1C7N947_9FUNG|nr:Pentafunctional AROM polypeptide [Choanephora cucurbitarum]
MVVDIDNITRIQVLNEPNAIHAGYNLMRYIANDVTTVIGNVSNYVIITDINIASIYLQPLLAEFRSHLSPHQRLLSRILPSGEQTKSRQAKANIEDFLLDSSCTRDTCFIALGGGVIGDLVGYVASTFMRGAPFVQIPTTLLAMVDSSIGGKTAIDTPHGKNLIGAFWQPKRIYLDLAVLGTLPKRELANGMAEVIKTAAISSESEFIKLETGKDKFEKAILSLNKPNKSSPDEESAKEFLSSVVCASARFKANVVTQDEKESGLRGLLNFGHSIGHAYEAVLSPDWLHGECISLGLIHEAELSVSLGHCSPSVVERLTKCLSLYHLPTIINEKTKSRLVLSKVMTAMKVDKKNKGSQKRIVLISQLGKTFEPKASDVCDEAIEAILLKYISAKQSIFDNEQPQAPTSQDQINVSFELIATSEPMKPLISELCRMLSDKFNMIMNASKDLRCITCAPSTASKDHYLVYFTLEAGTSAVDLNSPCFEYVVPSVSNASTTKTCQDAFHFLQRIACQQQRHIVPSNRKQSTFVTLPVPSYDAALPSLVQQWLENTDAIEYRVDHLDCTGDWTKMAGDQLMKLRQNSNLPIVYTVRTEPQAGKFNASWINLYLELIQWGHHWGCEYVDVEINTLSDEQLKSIMELNQLYPATKIVASFHDPQHQYSWSSNDMKDVYNKAVQLFEHHRHQGVIKIVGYAQHFYDNIELEVFRHEIDPHQDKKIIMINMGPYGKLSRVTNNFLSPATHPVLPMVAAPGQLSVAELSAIRKELAMDK